MAGPTTAALERDIVALTHRIVSIEREIHELRDADSKHDQRDWEEFESHRERMATIDKGVEEAKRIIADISRDVQDVEKKVEQLVLSGAKDKPWIDLWKKLLVMVLCAIAGAAIAKLVSGL